MKITIAGAGYVGLVVGACYANTGNQVTIVDPDQDKIDLLNSGGIPIYEKGLQDILETNIAAERISFSTDPASFADTDIIAIAVGTPQTEDGSADMSFIREVAHQIGEHINRYCVVVTKSTVPIGTHEIVSDIIRDQTETPFDYVSNPEFLKEGAAIQDFLRPERVIIGTDSEKAKKILTHLYAPFMRKGLRILYMDPTSAEAAKYACNAMLAVRISFMNEMARLADVVGADIQQIRMAMGTDNRIGSSFLFPGIGYGGSCFPKDMNAIVHTGEKHGVEMNIIKTAHSTNDRQVDYFLDKISSYFKGKLTGKRLAIWGLAFKPNTDDIREAPAIKLIRKLLDQGVLVSAYDPKANDYAKAILGDSISFYNSAYETLTNADGLVICTEWMEFSTPDLSQVATKLKQRVIFDARNIYSPECINSEGIDYICIGRPDAISNQ